MNEIIALADIKNLLIAVTVALLAYVYKDICKKVEELKVRVTCVESEGKQNIRQMSEMVTKADLKDFKHDIDKMLEQHGSFERQELFLKIKEEIDKLR